MIRVRRAAKSDMPDILAIERDCFSPPWSEESLLREVCGDDAFFAVATEDGVVLGFVILRRAADEGEIFQIAVTRPARNRGAADKLIRSAIRWAADNALSALYLEIRASNTPAAGLYLKHGFAVTGRRKKYYADPDEDAYIMSRLL